MNQAVDTSEQIPLFRENIPVQLKEVRRWVIWRAGTPNSKGKFDKVPIDVRSGHNVNGNDPKNWMSFDDACAAYDAGKCTGIGIALCDEPIGTWGGVLCGAPQYLIGLDFDQCGSRLGPIKQLRNDLGGIYGEISPSLDGIRLVGVSRVLIKGGNAGGGRELYSTGRFVTVTGIGGKGDVIDATDGLLQLSQGWFPPKAVNPPRQGHAALSLAKPPKPETTENISKVQDQLGHVSADCTYETWRDIVFSVLSSGWGCAEELARDWSMTAPERFDQRAFDTLAGSFDPLRGITLGTLYYHAEQAGWKAEQMTLSLPSAPTGQIPLVQGKNRLLTAMDLKALPVQPYRVRGMLPARGVAAIYGPSGSGKSFLVLDLVLAVAQGASDWFGHKIKPAPVAYVALEGQSGVSKRVAAWEMHKGLPAPGNVRFLLGGLTLLAPNDGVVLASEILEAVGNGAVVVIDTLNQSAPGADENSSVDMSTVIANAQSLSAAVEGLVILVHHTGKDSNKGLRGHSSLFAALDSVVEVLCDKNNNRAWRMTKTKDDALGTQCGFDLVPYSVGVDEDGLAVTSCAVGRQMFPLNRPIKSITGKRQIAAMGALSVLLASRNSGLKVDEATAAVATVMDCQSGRKLAAAKETIKNLTENGYLQQDEGVVILL